MEAIKIVRLVHIIKESEMCDIITNLIKQYKLGELSKRDFLREAVMKTIESEKGEVILMVI